MPIRTATINDIPALVTLLNSSYRGEDSKIGWTTEAHLLEGDIRTDQDTLVSLMKNEDTVFLVYADDLDIVQGSVCLEIREKKLWLGMLCVAPQLQANGIGKKIMAAANNYVKEKGLKSIFIKVISVRYELIAWYERQGYSGTGEREPFPDIQRFGKPLQPLEFLIMEKKL